jgi:hypothetical protein
MSSVCSVVYFTILSLINLRFNGENAYGKIRIFPKKIRTYPKIG